MPCGFPQPNARSSPRRYSLVWTGSLRRPSKLHGQPRFSDVLSACGLARRRGDPGLRLASASNVVENESTPHRPRRSRRRTNRGREVVRKAAPWPWSGVPNRNRRGYGAPSQGATCRLSNRQRSRVPWCPANSCQTISLFDRLHRTRGGSLGSCICPSPPATRLLARTTGTVAPAPDCEWRYAANRIISARELTRAEKEAYEEETKK